MDRNLARVQREIEIMNSISKMTPEQLKAIENEIKKIQNSK